MREERLHGNELKTVWVLENIREGEPFSMNGVELLYLEASVTQWKKMQKTTPCYLICTADVYAFIEERNLIHLWDGFDTEILAQPDNVARKPFWAAAKLKAMREISAPFVMMDNDLFITSPFPFSERGAHIFDGRYPLVVSYLEDGSNYYISAHNNHLRAAGIEDLYFHAPPLGYNVSFLYIRDDDFREEYSSRAWSWLEKLSAIATGPIVDKSQIRWQIIPSNLHGGYMVFCEQKLLYDMAEEKNFTTKILIPDIFDCSADTFLSISAQQTFIKHLGRKKMLLVNASDYSKQEAMVLSVLGRNSQ